MDRVISTGRDRDLGHVAGSLALFLVTARRGVDPLGLLRLTLNGLLLARVGEAFVTAWADYVVWRKQRGISRIEAARVGAKQAA